MERQLKERLIGAAVLLTAAVVMVPEMFSGPRSRPSAAAESESANSGQLKTYRIELQSQPPSTTAAAIDEPAERPQNETSSAASSNAPMTTAEAGSSSSSSSSQTALASVSKPALPAKSVESVESEKSTDKPVSKPTGKPAEAIAKPTVDGWVVQVGSFAAQDKAQSIAKTLKSQGYSAYVGPVNVGNKTLYRVRVGAAAERPAAEATLRKLKTTYPAASVVPTSR